jgi:acetyl esterase/lipase
VGQLDIFRDEDMTYALRLARSGVEVEFHLRPGVPHMWDLLAPDADVTRRAFRDRVRILKSLNVAASQARSAGSARPAAWSARAVSWCDRRERQGEWRPGDAG